VAAVATAEGSRRALEHDDAYALFGRNDGRAQTGVAAADDCEVERRSSDGEQLGGQDGRSLSESSRNRAGLHDERAGAVRMMRGFLDV
jgi:hypothetical protein